MAEIQWKNRDKEWQQVANTNKYGSHNPAISIIIVNVNGLTAPIKRQILSSVHFSSVTQSCPALCDPWTTACQASLPITNSRTLSKLMSMMPSNNLILCHPLLLLPSIFPSDRVFSNESVLHIRWPKYWSFSFNIVLPINTQD